MKQQVRGFLLQFCNTRILPLASDYLTVSETTRFHICHPYGQVDKMRKHPLPNLAFVYVCKQTGKPCGQHSRFMTQQQGVK